MLKGVVQGYKPQVDWGGESGSATIVLGQHNVRLATSGWRRRCLFILLVSLLLISFFNFLLTLWIIQAIKFNSNGVGSLNIVNGGVKLNGRAILGGKVVASKIQGHAEKDLSIKGYHNVSLINLRDDGNVTSALLLHDRGLRAHTQGLRVLEPSGNTLFSADPDGMMVGAKSMKVLGYGEASFKESVMTPKLFSEDVHEFRIESTTRGVDGTAAEEVLVEARDGDVSVTSLSGVNLVAGGKINLETPNVFFPILENQGLKDQKKTNESDEMFGPRLKARSRASARYLPTESPIDTQIPAPTTTVFTTESPIVNEKSEVQVFQVCVCPSGRLFLAAADAVCQPDKFTCR